MFGSYFRASTFAFLVVATPVASLDNLIPGRAEAITDHYQVENGSLVRNSHAVGQLDGCSTTWISPFVVLTAAHCSIRVGDDMANEAYANRSMKNVRATIKFTECQRHLATGFYASGADFALWECRPKALVDTAPGELVDTDVLPGGVQYATAVFGKGAASVGDDVYSVWRNRVTKDPELRDQGRSSIYSEGKVTHIGVGNNWSGPSLLGCGSVPKTNGKTSSVDGHYMAISMFSFPGASGSLQFDARTHQVVAGPQATGTSNSRESMTLLATMGRELPAGDRMVVETYIPNGRLTPKRVQTRFRYQVAGGIEENALANCFDVTQLKNLAMTDRNGDFVYDVVAETMDWNWRQNHQHFSFADPLMVALWS